MSPLNREREGSQTKSHREKQLVPVSMHYIKASKHLTSTSQVTPPQFSLVNSQSFFLRFAHYLLFQTGVLPVCSSKRSSSPRRFPSGKTDKKPKACFVAFPLVSLYFAFSCFPLMFNPNLQKNRVLSPVKNPTPKKNQGFNPNLKKIRVLSPVKNPTPKKHQGFKPNREKYQGF